MITVGSCNKFFCFFGAISIQFLNFSDKSNAENNLRLRHKSFSIAGNLEISRNRRAVVDNIFESILNCNSNPGQLIYCPFNYSIQLTASTYSVQAQIALCRYRFSQCPATVNTSSLVYGCTDGHSCGSVNSATETECKAPGSGCYNGASLRTSTSLNCCNAKFITPIGEELETTGVCRTGTYTCEPEFPLNTVCGDSTKNYLACNKAVCRFPSEPIQDSTDGLARVSSRSQPPNQSGVEVKSCVSAIQPCGPGRPYRIYCGSYLSSTYDNYSFCDCPSADMKIGYSCRGGHCEACNLNGGYCSSTAECCSEHTCVDGKCRITAQQPAQNDVTYCPLNNTFQIDGNQTATNVEIALCASQFPTCPQNLNTSTLLDGRTPNSGCESDDRLRVQCKAAGSSCVDPSSQSVNRYLDCCSGRVDTPYGKRIVDGYCNPNTNKCEFYFPLGTICGNATNVFLNCNLKSSAQDVHCTYPTQVGSGDGPPSVSRRYFKVEANEGLPETPKRCAEGPFPCSTSKSVTTYCGLLPDNYNDYPFCDCPSPDLKTGYNCVGGNCQACKLNGGSCSTASDCCIAHDCVEGVCTQCLPHLVFSYLKCDKDRSRGATVCCDNTEICKKYDSKSFCSKRPVVDNAISGVIHKIPNLNVNFG